MAEDKGDIKETRNNRPRDRNNLEEDPNGAQQYLPNVVRLEPDIGLGNRVQEDRKFTQLLRYIAEILDTEFDCISGPRRNEASQPRREEGSISFRHFLQNNPGTSNAAYPDLYNCSRQENSHFDGSNLDPDSPDLPDFVQDHLAVEHMYFNDGTVTGVQNLPDFASCVPRINPAVHRHRSGTSSLRLLFFTIRKQVTSSFQRCSSSLKKSYCSLQFKKNCTDSVPSFQNELPRFPDHV